MEEFTKILVITIIAELIAAALLVFLGGLLSKRLRWMLTAVLGRILNIEIEYVFRNKAEADDDIREEMCHTSFILFLTGRGNELQRDTFKEALEGKVEFKILLPVTSTPQAVIDWTAQREEEIATIDQAFGKGILGKQIETNVDFLQGYLNSENVELKRYNYPHIGRILITDRAAYFTPYRQAAHGRDSRIIKYRRGEMYDCLVRLFNQLWTYS
jgi:hypothetical protein